MSDSGVDESVEPMAGRITVTGQPPAAVAQGRTFVIVIIVLVMLGVALEVFGREITVVVALLALALWAGLCYFLYMGKGWARWLLIIDQVARGAFGVFGALMLFLFALSNRGMEGASSGDMLVFGVISLLSGVFSTVSIAIGIALWRSQRIKAFLDYQNNLRHA